MEDKAIRYRPKLQTSDLADVVSPSPSIASSNSSTGDRVIAPPVSPKIILSVPNVTTSLAMGLHPSLSNEDNNDLSSDSECRTTMSRQITQWTPFPSNPDHHPDSYPMCFYLVAMGLFEPVQFRVSIRQSLVTGCTSMGLGPITLRGSKVLDYFNPMHNVESEFPFVVTMSTRMALAASKFTRDAIELHKMVPESAEWFPSNLYMTNINRVILCAPDPGFGSWTSRLRLADNRLRDELTLRTIFNTGLVPVTGIPRFVEGELQRFLMFEILRENPILLSDAKQMLRVGMILLTAIAPETIAAIVNFAINGAKMNQRLQYIYLLELSFVAQTLRCLTNSNTGITMIHMQLLEDQFERRYKGIAEEMANIIAKTMNSAEGIPSSMEQNLRVLDHCLEPIAVRAYPANEDDSGDEGAQTQLTHYMLTRAGFMTHTVMYESIMAMIEMERSTHRNSKHFMDAMQRIYPKHSLTVDEDVEMDNKTDGNSHYDDAEVPHHSPSSASKRHGLFGYIDGFPSVKVPTPSPAPPTPLRSVTTSGIIDMTKVSWNGVTPDCPENEIASSHQPSHWNTMLSSLSLLEHLCKCWGFIIRRQPTAGAHTRYFWEGEWYIEYCHSSIPMMCLALLQLASTTTSIRQSVVILSITDSFQNLFGPDNADVMRIFTNQMSRIFAAQNARKARNYLTAFDMMEDNDVVSLPKSITQRLNKSIEDSQQEHRRKTRHHHQKEVNRIIARHQNGLQRGLGTAELSRFVGATEGAISALRASHQVQLADAHWTVFKDAIHAANDMKPIAAMQRIASSNRLHRRGSAKWYKSPRKSIIPRRHEIGKLWNPKKVVEVASSSVLYYQLVHVQSFCELVRRHIFARFTGHCQYMSVSGETLKMKTTDGIDMGSIRLTFGQPPWLLDKIFHFRSADRTHFETYTLTIDLDGKLRAVDLIIANSPYILKGGHQCAALPHFIHVDDDGGRKILELRGCVEINVRVNAAHTHAGDRDAVRKLIAERERAIRRLLTQMSCPPISRLCRRRSFLDAVALIYEEKVQHSKKPNILAVRKITFQKDRFKLLIKTPDLPLIQTR